MDPTVKSAHPEDIGTVVAIVGTKGWQCRLCTTTFPRSISIEHHMLTDHHSPSKESALPSTNKPVRSVGDTCTCHGLNEEQGDVMHDVSPGSTFRMAGNGVQKENTSEVLAAVTERVCRAHEGCSVIKVEAKMDCFNSSENLLGQESLPVYFDNKFEQQCVNKANTSTSQGNPRIHNAKVELHGSQNVNAGSKSTESCPVYPVDQGSKTQGTCPHQVRRRLAAQKATNSLKPVKRRTCSCGQEFETKQDFKYHRRIAHCQLKCKTFACPICNAQYLYKRGLNHHLAEKGLVPILCPDCSKQFHDQTALKEHRKQHHSSEAHYTVPSANDRRGDCTDQTQDASFCDKDLTSYYGTENIFPWECSKCKSHFWDKPGFRKHLKDCGVLIVRDGKRNFCCSLCTTSFDRLVDYHRHYVRDHKPAFLGDSHGSPAHFSPFLGNSPVSSPAPSVTSEINTAMAGVSLNQSRVLEGRENSSPCPSTIDLTSDTGMEEDITEQSSVEDHKSSLDSNPTSLTAAAVCSNSNLHTPATDCLDPHSLTSTTGSSDSFSLTSGTSSSDPQSLFSTVSSSDPMSLTAFSSLSSLPSTASSRGQAREGDTIIISDMEESHSSDSSSESDEEWEIIMHQNAEEKALGSPRAPHETQHKEGGFSHRNMQHSHPAPPLHGHPLPPPPYPHPDESLQLPLPPPPPPPFSNNQHFIPPHGRPFHPPPPPHHHRRFGHGRFFHGRGMHGPWAFHGAARFGPPNWLCQDSGNMSDYLQKSETATGVSPSHETAQEPCPGSAHTAPSEQESNSSQTDDDAAQAAHDQWHFAKATPFMHAAGFCKWMGKWKEDKKCAKVMWKKVFWGMVKSCQQGVQFLFCPECLQTFHEESELEKHSQENHPTSRESICFLCQQPQTDPLSYNRHIKQHCETLLQVGSRGGRGRGRGHGLMGLGRGMHHIIKWLWKAGSPYDMFSSHSHGHHTHETDKDTDNPEGSASEDFKECPVCQKRYRANSRESFFERHYKSHFGVEVYSFKCEECGKTFLEKGKFTAHQAKHKTSPYVCKVCGNHYQSKTSLKRHERIHTGERPHKCPDCGEGFIELRELERHRMKHTGQDPFQCKVCEKGFTLKDSLLNHIRKQHPEENPNLCVKRAMPLLETDQPRKEGLSMETQASTVTVKTEKTSEPQKQSFMELD